nr:MAG TPA: hypothetical protein [Caudoviricetes sp.]
MNRKERNLSGIYTRIKRDGKYKTIDITDMIQEELAEFLDSWKIDFDYLAELIKNLVETIQTIAEKLDIQVDEEE